MKRVPKTGGVLRRTLSLLLVLGACLLMPLAARAQGPMDGGERTEDGAQPDRLGAPELSDNPTQLEYGAHEYAQRCAACHGDVGQGLTDEWRAAWGEEEQNCWQSKCHAGNHPPEGFRLPHFAPAIVGEGALARFGTASELFTFIQERMPWHMPGSLEAEMVWQLTAFLAERNQVVLPPEPLDPTNADMVRFHPDAPTSVPPPVVARATPVPAAPPTATVAPHPPTNPAPLVGGVAGGLALVLLVALALRRR